MSNALLDKARSIFTADNMNRAWGAFSREAVGLAQDFWKDGPGDGPGKAGKGRLAAATPVSAKPENLAPASYFKKNEFPHAVVTTADGLWHAEPGEIAERMWGQSCVLPCDDRLTELMTTPMKLTKEMSVLDLSAGLGERMQQMKQAFGVTVTGREWDGEIATRGSKSSSAAGFDVKDAIALYDPQNFSEPRQYDGIITRETLYLVADKGKFIASILASCKPRAHVSFTDYIVNPESAAHPAIGAWRNFEKGSEPLGLIAMAELWAKAGIRLTTHDDQTEVYKKEVKQGLAHFVEFMASGVRPDAPTLKEIQSRIALWAHRLGAMDAGMKLYRFYGMRG